jgi:hypothetical protein
MGLFIDVQNLMLIHKARRREAADGAETESRDGGPRNGATEPRDRL